MNVTKGVWIKYAALLDDLAGPMMKEYDARAKERFDVSIEELRDLYKSEYAFKDYFEFRNYAKLSKHPDHFVEFMLPITLKSMNWDWCPALLEEARERHFDNKVPWAANTSFEVLMFKFKFPGARTYELVRARSRLYKFRRASPSARLWWNLSSQ